MYFYVNIIPGSLYSGITVGLFLDQLLSLDHCIPRSMYSWINVFPGQCIPWSIYSLVNVFLDQGISGSIYSSITLFLGQCTVLYHTDTFHWLVSNIYTHINPVAKSSSRSRSFWTPCMRNVFTSSHKTLSISLMESGDNSDVCICSFYYDKWQASLSGKCEKIISSLASLWIPNIDTRTSMPLLRRPPGSDVSHDVTRTSANEDLRGYRSTGVDD